MTLRQRKTKSIVIGSPSNRIGMLILLTFLFVAGQAILFAIHYKVSDLVDSLVNDSMGQNFFHWFIWLPILEFLLIQLIAYGLFIAWIQFVTTAVGKLFKFSNTLIHGLSLFIWVLGCGEILLLNNYFFPNSFFAYFLQESYWGSLLPFIFMVLSIAWGFLTLLAYFYYFRERRMMSGTLFLLIAFAVGALVLYDKLIVSRVPPLQSHSKPNIILIGLDSLRPDFTNFFGNTILHTPHINHFLQTATTFTEAYTPLARTFPAWMSILTAFHPRHHHARNNLADPSLLEHDTLAKRMQQAGYETIYATDEKRFSNITESYGFDRILGPSMGVNDFLLGGLSDFPLTNLLIDLPFGRFLFPYNYANRAANVTYSPNLFLHLIRLGLVKRQNKPLFLAVHLCLSHWPFNWAGFSQYNHLNLPNQYMNSVEAVDAQLGKLLQILKKQKLLEHSLVILLSDHGTALGLLGDRLLDKENYLGDQEKLKFISIYKKSVAAKESLDYARDYTINTSYGQGTDVLSLKQYQVLLAFKGFGLQIPAQQIKNRYSLMDIAPTILDLLNLPPMPQRDGMSLATYFKAGFANELIQSRAFFIETGDKFSEIETDKISIEKVLKQRINAYKINANNGLLILNPIPEQSLIKSKQRAILLGDWLLARYPAQLELRLEPASGNHLIPVPAIRKAYFVLFNLRTHEWTIGTSSPLAKKAPVQELMKKLKEFYGDEL